MIRCNRRRVTLPVSAFILAAFLTGSSVYAQAETHGQRVFFSGHSFHFFMPPILADIAKKAEIKEHTHVGHARAAA